MKNTSPMEAFSLSYIHIFLYGYTHRENWWINNGVDWWSGVYTFTGNVLYYLTEGEMKLQIGDRRYHAYSGDMIYIPANTTHERFICPDTLLKKYYCSFDLSFGKNPLHHSFEIPYVTRVGDSEEVTALFQSLVDHCQNNSHPYATIGQNGALLQLLSILLKESEAPLLFNDDRIEQKMLAVNEYINANLHRTVTVEELAHLAGYSRGHFTKIFQNHFKRLPLQYVSDIKLEYAKKRLTETNLPVSAIAEKLGFCDASYFGKFFKKQTGLSPAQYRKNIKHII